MLQCIVKPTRSDVSLTQGGSVIMLKVPPVP
jgi:hypothetical protein